MGGINRLKLAWRALKGANLSQLLGLSVSPGEDVRGKIQPGDYQAMVDSYESWVYACVSVIASTAAATSLYLYANKNGKREQVFEHVFLDMMKNVNPFMNRFELWELTLTFLELTGNAYWWIVPNRLGVPAEIWVIPSQNMKVVPDKREFLKGYLYGGMGNQVAFEREEIIHFKYPNPKSLYYGMGPLEAARYEVSSNEYQKKYEMALFKNQARPDGVLETDEMLDDPTLTRLHREWEQAHRGPDRAYRVAILERGLKYKQVQISPRDLDFLQGRKVTRDEICAIFKVPLSKLGIVEDVNRANAEANDYTFRKDTVAPKLIRIEEKLNERLLPRYDQNLECAFENIIPGDKEFMLKERETNLKVGFSTINEERERVGREPVPWGNVPYLPVNLIPLPGKSWGKSAPTRVLDKGQGDRHEKRREARLREVRRVLGEDVKNFGEKMEAYFARQRRIVLRNLRQLRSIKQGDIDEGAVDYILFPRDEEAKKLQEMSTPAVVAALEKWAKREMAKLGLEIAFDIQNPKVQEWILNRVFHFSFQVNDATLESLRSTLVEAINLGESVREIAGRVNEVFNFAQDYRAVRIARTEIMEAANKGALEAYRQSGVVQKKEWVAQPDACPVCEENENDGAISLDATFSSGDSHPTVHPNCECTIAPVIEEV